MDSAEYKTLTQSYPTLVTCIQLGPNDIAVQLRPSGVLAPRDLQYLSNPNHDSDEKARRLLDTILTQVQIDSQVYHKFMKALRNAGSWTNSAVSQVESTYTSLGGVLTVSPSTDQTIETLKEITGVTDTAASIERSKSDEREINDPIMSTTTKFHLRTEPEKDKQPHIHQLKNQILQSSSATQYDIKRTQLPNPPQTGFRSVAFNESQMFCAYVNSHSLYQIWTAIKEFTNDLHGKTSIYHPTLVELCTEEENTSDSLHHLRIIFRASWRCCQEVIETIKTTANSIEARLKDLESHEKCKHQDVHTLQTSLHKIHKQVRNCKLYLEQSIRKVKELEEDERKRNKLHHSSQVCCTVGSLFVAMVIGAVLGMTVGIWAAIPGCVIGLIVGVIGHRFLLKKNQDTKSLETLKLCCSHISEFKESIVEVNDSLHKILNSF